MGMNFFTQLMDQGGVLMGPLLLCSVLGVAVVLERGIQVWLVSKAQSEADATAMLTAIHLGDLAEMKRLGESSPDAVVQLLVQVHGQEPKKAQAIVDYYTGGVVARLNCRLSILDTIVVVAPLLGILGTVLGIIDSFNLLGQGGVQDPKAVTSGIAEALITTAMGLSIAIVTTVPYHYFLRYIERVETRFNMALAQFELMKHAD